MINRKITPPTQKIESLQFQTPVNGELNNGIVYHGFYSGNAPVIKLDLIFNAGVEYQDIALQSVLANSLIKEAPKGMSSNETAEFFDYYGSYVETFAGAETSGLRLFVSSKNFDEVLPVFADLIQKPSLPKSEFEILQRKYEHSILNNLKKTKYVAMRGLNLEVFGESHQLGYFVNPEDAFKISHSDISDFVSRHYTAENCEIIISGCFDDKMLDLLNDYFGKSNVSDQWSNKTQKIRTVGLNGNMQKLKLYEFPEAVQSSIYGGLILSPETDEEIINLGILNTVFGGYFGSRLMKNIREDKGYTYGIGSFIVEYSNSVLLKIVSDVGVDVTNNAIEEVYKEINFLRNNLVNYEELNLVKNYMMGELISSLDGVIPTSMVFEKLFNRNRNEDFIRKNIEQINSISSVILLEYANRFLNPERMVFIVAGKC